MEIIPDGEYSVLTMVLHRGQNTLASLPLLVSNGRPVIVTEWFDEDDEEDIRTKSEVEISLWQLQKVPAQMGADYLYQAPGIVVPDSVEL